jgi:tripartite-type tricarboxylate transporter receptor subunit TctC
MIDACIGWRDDELETTTSNSLRRDAMMRPDNSTHGAARRSSKAAHGLVVAASSLLLANASVLAKEDFKGQTITFIMGAPSGGGYDSYVRPLVQHMGFHIPGNPTMIVQSMPGAGGVRAANYIYNNAPKDGTVVGLVSSTTVFEPLFGNTEAHYATPRFTWIGNVDEIVGTCDVWHSAGIDGIEDVLKREVTFGAGGSGSASAQLATALKNLLGAKINLVRGYSGGPEINLAMQRGEVGGSCGISLSALKTVYATDYRAGRLRPIIQFGLDRHPDLPGVADINDFAKNDEDRGVFDIVFGRYVLGRPILAPPGLSPERAKLLRTAFMDTMADPGFLADAEKQRIEIRPTSSEEVEKVVKRLFSYPQEEIAKAAAAMD